MPNPQGRFRGSIQTVDSAFRISQEGLIGSPRWNPSRLLRERHPRSSSREDLGRRRLVSEQPEHANLLNRLPKFFKIHWFLDKCTGSQPIACDEVLRLF